MGVREEFQICEHWGPAPWDEGHGWLL